MYGSLIGASVEQPPKRDYSGALMVVYKKQYPDMTMALYGVNVGDGGKTTVVRGFCF